MIRRSAAALRTLVTAALAFVVAATAVVAAPAPAVARGLISSEVISAASIFGAPVGSMIDAITGSPAFSNGSDGRLTVLLLGSDTRGGGVARTDTIMIMSLDGNTISAASIPRDTARIPNLLTPAPSDNFKGRVNAILKKLINENGKAAGFEKFERLIELLLDIEIDYHALVTFRGFESLVDVVDPIYINNSNTVRDPKFWDAPNFKSGVWFPASASYRLESLPLGPLCNGLWRDYTNPPLTLACHRALPYVRSRKGKGNSDFVRARRQQNFVGAVIRTITSSDISPLVNAANGQASTGALYTNFPFNASSLNLYNALANANLGPQVVFSPSTYSSRIPGTTAYQLNLSAVRAWTAANMR